MTLSARALSLENVRFRWSGRAAFGLSVPEFRVSRGESVLLLGESGSGKSTLLSLICGIVTADEGRVSVGGTDLSSLRTGARDRFRAEHIGVIFQQFNLLPYASVSDNIQLPLRFAPARRKRAAPDEAARLCAALGLPEGITDVTAGHLSVGQQQRVAVARALIGQPPLIVADEPTSALDAATQDSFLALLSERIAATGASLLMVSHDERLGARFDRVVRLSDIAQTDGMTA
ncbi:ABC transporter ATP-binding protein [Tropicibacter naphthalenivorans]|uniref:ABC transporter ATP-binding protein YtrE n=1 Tax=Tropicibacter naphthalenivorans TaxID=441103 RepID=A0A0P1GH55_9RHOB|nr:ABC transporter ATP-binding protein [Tropicibacter naphthalenivorans]CUH80995.1 ABC transporter ATP-binding protein YtrE [Tropicibacter naphthalenivorans]SMC91804.1 putative ABC transport system ATP-binding protein [Tropicibacter naphthalenivorans]